MITIFSDSPRILNYSKDSKSKLVWLICAHISWLQHLLQIQESSILDKEFTVMIYKDCTNIKLTCTHNISKLKKILKIQKCYRLRKNLRMPEIWIHREIEITFTISSGLKHGQGVLHCDLQSFLYNMVDMHNLTRNIQEVMTFTKWLTDKQIQQKRAVWNLGYIAIFGPLEQLYTQLQNLCKFSHM
jgi:hypothetical protein